MCLGQGLGASVQLKKFQNLFRGFGIFSEIVRVTLFFGTYCNVALRKIRFQFPIEVVAII